MCARPDKILNCGTSTGFKRTDFNGKEVYSNQLFQRLAIRFYYFLLAESLFVEHRSVADLPSTTLS